MEEDDYEIEKFDGSNYVFWRVQVEDILYVRDLYLPINGEKPNDMKQHKWDILDRKALEVVRLALAPSILSKTAKEKTTVDLFNALEKLHRKSLAMNKFYLVKKLFNLKMSEDAVVAEHLKEFNIVCNQLDSIGITFDDEVKALVLLSSLPDSWSSLVVCVSNSFGSTKIKQDDVAGLILGEEFRRMTLREEIRRKKEGDHISFNVDDRSRNSTKGNRGKNKRRSNSKCHL